MVNGTHFCLRIIACASKNSRHARNGFRPPRANYWSIAAPSFDLLFVAEDAEEPESTLRQLARYLRRDEKELLAILEENKKRPAFEEIVIGKDVDWATVVAVETPSDRFTGSFAAGAPAAQLRRWPIGAHVLGYLGEIGPKQLKILKEQGYATGDEFGQYGLEKSGSTFFAVRAAVNRWKWMHSGGGCEFFMKLPTFPAIQFT